MANKRAIKRNITLTSADLLAECMAIAVCNDKVDKGDINALIYAIIHMTNDYICRVSHPEPGMKAREYYRDLVESYAKEVGEKVDQINNLL